MSKTRGYTDTDMAEVSDNPEWTDEELARAVPFTKAFPGLAESVRAGVEIVSLDGNAPVAILLEEDVAAYYRSFGECAQARLSADLRKIAGLPEPA